MRLMTKEIERAFPKLREMDGRNPDEVKVVAKFFTPDAQWTWYATEWDGEDTFFGYVDGHEREYGYFSLSELKKVRGGLGLPVERDRHFKATLGQVIRRERS